MSNPRDFASVRLPNSLVFDVQLICPGHPKQPDLHVRRVFAPNEVVAAKKARAFFRIEHKWPGSVEIVNVSPVAD